MKSIYLSWIFYFFIVLSNAQTWDSVGTGIDGGVASFGTVRSLAVHNGELIVGGGFTAAGSIPTNNIAKWNGNNWSALGIGANGTVSALSTYNNELYAAGAIGNYSIMKWNGSTWEETGQFGGAGTSMVVYNGELYTAGYGVMSKWNGSTWASIWFGASVPIFSLAVYNGELYTGGYFSTASGGIPVSNIAKWNGTTWSTVGTGLNHSVWSLAVYNNELYAGGSFTAAGVSPTGHIAKWDGTNWSAVGMGIDTISPYGKVSTLCTFNNELYAGGDFHTADGNSANNIAKWNGTNWQEVGGGVDSVVYALYVYDSVLYAGGDFSHAGGIPASRIAKWNPLGVGISVNLDERESTIAPNPFSNFSTIVLNKEVKNADLSIYTIHGKEVGVMKFSGNQVVIEKNDMAEGLYFYKITSDNEVVATGKLIIQ